MTLTWYGTASLIVEHNGKKIAFDAFDGIKINELKNKPQQLEHEASLKNVDAVFLTHGHFDHLYHIKRLYGDSDIPVYCTKTPAKTLEKYGLPRKNINVIKAGETIKIDDISISTFKSKHCKFDLPLIFKTVFSKRFFKHIFHTIRLLFLDIKCKENKEILFYELTCGNNRIQIMGSMNLDSKTDYPTNATCLILPFQGRSDINDYAVRFVERLKPQKILLDHYDNSFEPLTNDIDVTEFTQSTQKKYNIPCQALLKEQNIII